MVAAVTRMTSGLSPTTLDKALTDWSHHFAFSPGKSPQLDGQAGGKYAPLFEHLIRSAHQRDRSEEHTSELQSLMRISYAVFCLKKKKTKRVYLNLNTPTNNNEQ